MRRTSPQAERREWIAAALTEDPSRSDRAVGRACGTSHSTVAAVRVELERDGRISRRMDRPDAARQATAPNLVRALPGVPGATLKHGSNSEAVVGPIRQRHLARLRQRFPAEDEDELLIAASRRAKIEVLSEYLDRIGLVRRGGDVRGAVVELGRLETALERQLARFAGRARELRRVAPEAELAAVVAEIRAGRVNGGTDG